MELKKTNINNNCHSDEIWVFAAIKRDKITELSVNFSEENLEV